MGPFSSSPNSDRLVLLAALLIPPLVEDINSNDLPDGVESAQVSITTDAGNVVFEGSHSPASIQALSHAFRKS